MSSGLFPLDKGSGFTVCCLVTGNGPDGAGPSDGGESATRRSRLHPQEKKTRSLGRDVQGSGQVSTAILRPALLLEKGEFRGLFAVCCLVTGNGPDGAGLSDGGDSATRRSRLHRQERKTRSLGRDVQGGGQVSTAILRPALLLEKGEFRGWFWGFWFTVCCFRFPVEGRATAQTELGPPKEGEKGAASDGSGF